MAMNNFSDMEHKISQSSKHSTDEKVSTVQYGDGYTQRAVIGQNQQADAWSLTFNVMNQTERDDFVAFFRDKGRHQNFKWTAFGDSFEKAWMFSSKLSESNIGCDKYRLSLNIQQVFDIGA